MYSTILWYEYTAILATETNSVFRFVRSDVIKELDSRSTI